MGTASQHCDLNTDSCSTAFMNDSYVMFSLCSTTLGFHPPPHSAPHPLISLSPRFFWHRCTFALCHPYRSSSNLKVLLCVNINTSWLELPSLWAAWVCMFLHRPTWMNILQTGKTEPTDGEGWGWGVEGEGGGGGWWWLWAGVLAAYGSAESEPIKWRLCLCLCLWCRNEHVRLWRCETVWEPNAASHFVCTWFLQKTKHTFSTNR